MPNRRPMTPADIRRQVVIEELDLSRDGRLAVVARRVVRGNRYLTHLHAISLDRGRVARPRRLTSGVVRDGQPRVSPDGTSVAFVRSNPAQHDDLASVAMLDLRRGTVRLVPRRGYGSVGEVAWSPDGRWIAFTAEVDPPRFIVGNVPPVDRARRRRGNAHEDVPEPTARRIDRVDWRWDGEGHQDRWSHLFVVGAARGSVPRQVTAGDFEVSAIAWAPNSGTVVFTSWRTANADLLPRPTIWAVDTDEKHPSTPPTAETREVMAPAGWAHHATVSPDGRWLAAIGILEAEPLDDVSPTILVGPADGSAAPWAPAPDLDRPIGNWTDTDLTGWMVSGRTGPFWRDPTSIVATVTDRGRSHPMTFLVDPATGKPGTPPEPSPRAATGPWSDATSHSLGVAADGTIAVLGTLDNRAMELMTLDGDRATPRWSTRSTFGSAWQRRFTDTEMRRVEAPGAGGPVETWIASPPGAGDKALPTVVDVHGGPLGGWAPAPHVEVMLLVASGYRVVLPNIRGSAGYGGDWIRPHLGDWGGVDAADVHAALDHVIALGLADPDRVGVLGLSYGGFMVHWLIGTSSRFRAAVSENGVTNQVSAWANSDSGPEYDRAALMGNPFTQDGVDRLWRQSPLRNVSAIETPLLMFQAESDLRCPPQDNEQLFIALRHLRRTVEYVLYPEESHVFSSSGRPDRRIDRMTRMLEWFDRYLRES